MVSKDSILNIHKQSIKGTKKKEHVPLFSILLGQLSKRIKKAIGADLMKAYISSKVLKHIYDRHCHEKKQEHVYLVIINHLSEIVCNPDLIKKNKEGAKKRGEVVFIKEINGEKYACPMEVERVKKGKKMIDALSVVSAFKLKRKGLYLEREQTLYTK